MKTQQSRQTSESHKEIEKILSLMIKAREKGDWQKLASFYLHTGNIMHVGTDFDEYFISWQKYESYMKPIIQNSSWTSIQTSQTHISISDDCHTAWYSQLIDTCSESKDEPLKIEGFRHTGVFIQHHGNWKLVMSHISSPILTGKENIMHEIGTYQNMNLY